MTPKTDFLFFKIHPFNFIIAFFYSLRGIVFAYEISLPRILCRRFRKVDPESYVDWDSWSEIREKAFHLWREMSDNFQEKRWMISILGYKTNFSRIAKEVISKEFEKMIILLELMERMERGNCRIVEPGLWRFLKKNLPDAYSLQKTGMIKRSNLNVSMDYSNDLFINFLYFAKFILRILRLITLVFKKSLQGILNICGVGSIRMN